jgi:hypothetical protein
VLFLYRPRQTWMPYRLPRNLVAQTAYNRSVQEQFDATRQIPAPEPSRTDPLDQVQALAEMHAAGTLTDEEFASAKARVLGTRA